MTDLQYTFCNGIAHLYVNRPEALNALTREIIDALDVWVERISNDAAVKILILGGTDHFAAGADIKGMLDCTPAEAKAFSFGNTFNKLADLPIPTIAAIDGYALGGGLELALACDLRVATATAKLGLPELSVGIMPGAGGTIRLPRLIGYSRAYEMIALGLQVSGEQALGMGLVNRIVEKESLLEECRSLAQTLMKKAPIALKTLKRTMTQGSSIANSSEAIAYETAQWSKLFDTEDQKEGMHAFIEKRRAIYQGN